MTTEKVEFKQKFIERYKETPHYFGVYELQGPKLMNLCFLQLYKNQKDHYNHISELYKGIHNLNDIVKDRQYITPVNKLKTPQKNNIPIIIPIIFRTFFACPT